MAKNENVKDQPVQTEEKSKFVLGKMNYILLAAGFLILVIGYFLLSGGASEDPNVFNPEIFNFRRITLAPIVLIIGFAVEIFAIMWRPRSKKD